LPEKRENMQLTLNAIFKDGNTQIVETDLATIVAWERKYKRKASDMASGIGVEDLAFLCYNASQKSGVTVPGTLDIYIDSLKDIKVVEQNNPKAVEDQ
jgi:hypothetical protein